MELSTVFVKEIWLLGVKWVYCFVLTISKVMPVQWHVC